MFYVLRYGVYILRVHVCVHGMYVYALPGNDFTPIWAGEISIFLYMYGEKKIIKDDIFSFCFFFKQQRRCRSICSLLQTTMAVRAVGELLFGCC